MVDIYVTSDTSYSQLSSDSSVVRTFFYVTKRAIFSSGGREL